MQLIRFSARSSFLSLLVACALEKRRNSKKKTKVAQTTGERGCAICYLGSSAPQTKFPNQLFNFQFSFKEESQVDSAVAEALLEANGVGLVEEATLENDAAVGSVRYAEDVAERCLRCLRCLRRRSVATASRDSYFSSSASSPFPLSAGAAVPAPVIEVHHDRAGVGPSEPLAEVGCDGVRVGVGLVEAPALWSLAVFVCR